MGSRWQSPPNESQLRRPVAAATDRACQEYRGLVRRRRLPRLTAQIRCGTGGRGRCADREHQAEDEKHDHAACDPHDAHILFIFVILVRHRFLLIARMSPVHPKIRDAASESESGYHPLAYYFRNCASTSSSVTSVVSPSATQ